MQPFYIHKTSRLCPNIESSSGHVEKSGDFCATNKTSIMKEVKRVENGLQKERMSSPSIARREKVNSEKEYTSAEWVR